MTEKEQKHIFHTWLEQYSSLLIKVVGAYAFTPFDRDDLFQEIAIQIWHSIPNFRQESGIITWLYRVTLNTAIKWTSKERKHKDGRSSFEDLGHLLEENTQNDERLAWLYEEIAGLEEVDRSITLLLLDGFSYKEIAAIIGISDSNVGVKIHRIKQYLITQSKKYDHYGI